MKVKIFLIAVLVIGLSACGNSPKKAAQNASSEREKIYELLFEAIKNDDAKTFDRLLEQVPNIDSLLYNDPHEEESSDIGLTLLGYACKNGRCDFAKKLIDRKADINKGQEDEYGVYDALWIAIVSQSECIVKLLLDKGADPNVIYGEYGMTSLILSSKKTNDNITKMLIDKGAKIDGAGDLGFDAEPQYPLMAAIAEINTEMAKYLIEKGCKLNIVVDDQTPLELATALENTELVNFINEYLRKNYRLKVDKSWYGRYTYTIKESEADNVTLTDEITLKMEPDSYTLEITPDSCVFSGFGYQLYFVEKCTIDQDGEDAITVRFYQLTDGSSWHARADYVAKLSRKNGKYYLNSPVLGDEAINDTDLEVARRER